MGLKRRPSRLWLFFWGRKRRGFPGLLVGVLLIAVAGAILSRLPIVDRAGYWAGLALLAALALVTIGAIAAGILGVLRPPGRR